MTSCETELYSFKIILFLSFKIILFLPLNKFRTSKTNMQLTTFIQNISFLLKNLSRILEAIIDIPYYMYNIITRIVNRIQVTLTASNTTAHP